MMNLIIGMITLLSLHSVGFCGEKKNLTSNIRVEIEYAGIHVIRLFNEGLICSRIDEKNHKKVAFFEFDSTNIKPRLKIYDFLNDEIDIMALDSIYDFTNSRTFTMPILITFMGDFGIKKIFWYAGQPDQLIKLLQLMNNLIPKEHREYYRILPPPNSKTLKN